MLSDSRMLVKISIMISILLAAAALQQASAQVPAFFPSVKDPDLIVEEYIPHLQHPTSIAFVDDETLLILHKNDGTVRVARNGILDSQPALDVGVANEGEQGMLGIAVKGSTVYLYFSESSSDGGEAISKRVYKYTWNGQELVDPVLVKDLPATRSYHNGGAMAVAPDGTVYLVVGDTGRYGLLQNNAEGELFPDTSVIMPVEPEGPYYAIGIRNSFGMAFDPVTGKMWITENGNDNYDEVNLVEPGFNSGWNQAMGPATDDQIARMVVDYGNYTYADPKFSWQRTVAPAGLTFIDSGPLSRYGDSLFVGDCNFGNIYRFELNEERDGFVIKDARLADKVANLEDSTAEIVFGERFGCVTDLDVGPDGLLYVTTYSPFTTSAIYRVVPKSDAGYNMQMLYVVAAVGAGIAGVIAYKRSRRKKSS
ncbi:MAG: PQQ-dependent sugar dehydrogenase [Nitrososphaera sp.]